MSSEIPFIKPSFPPPSKVAQAYGDIVEANWFTNFGPQERIFCDALADYLGGAVTVSTLANGTLALLAALDATVGHGDRSQKILIPSFTFVAVAQSVIWSGHTPRFIDVDARTWQPDHVSARALLERGEEDIAGLLVPNVFGAGNPDVSRWEELAADFALPLVLDSAAGFGSRYVEGDRVGGRGTCEIFSFHATKPFAIGEGGAVTSRDPDLIDRVRAFQNFGFGPGRDSTSLGLNAKLQELDAAVGLAQLPGLEDRLGRRQAVFARYRAQLEPAGLEFQPNAAASSLCFASVLCASAGRKAAVQHALSAAGVQSRDYYAPPIHQQSFFRSGADSRPAPPLLTTTDDLCARIVSIPIHDDMDPDDVERVVAAVLRGHA